MTQTGIQDCEAATSPLAYLADLLDYAVTHVRQDNAPITLSFLQTTFHQPFGNLPATCDAMHTQIAQVRLCAEVLRSYLKAHPPSRARQAELANAERGYRLAAYRALLNRLGASHDELRLVARSTEPAERAALADRLGIAAARLNGLLLEPDAMTEQALEKLFGLADTHRDALAEGAKLGDAQEQLTRWNLDGPEWGTHTDVEGMIYVRLKKPSATEFQVMLYRDQARTKLVAAGSRNTAVGNVKLSAANNSGLTGHVDIKYTADSDAIELAAVPSLLAWQLQQLRVRWRGQNQADDEAPIIDPDLISLSDLKNPVADDLAFSLWQARRTFITAQLANLKTLRESKPTALDGLTAILKNALALLASDKTPVKTVLAKAEENKAGNDIAPWLAQNGLERDAFAYLVRVATLVNANTPVLEAEWADVYALLAQTQKRRQFVSWREQERNQGITLSPDYFQPTTSTFEPLAWRATASARRDWQEALQARVDQERAVSAAFHQAVNTAEAATLPLLRDALIAALEAAGTNFNAQARWITDRLLIDAQTGGDQTTTRCSQAVETLQGLLYSLRTGQLSDTYPNLQLHAPDFDEEWTWLGSYATWRAAMSVFAYPENLLLPSLRTQQTPAFRALVNELRAHRRLTPEQARGGARHYADYYRDVCSLTLEASCQSETQTAEARTTLLYLFARGSATGKSYWSACDLQKAQTFWEAVPGVENAARIIGAVPYRMSNGERFIFLFVQSQAKGKPTLTFTRYNLERQTWDAEPTELELPSDSGMYTIVAVQAQTESEPPQLFLRGSGGLYVRSLDAEGTGWETRDAAASGQESEGSNEWAPFQSPGYPTGSSLRAVLKTNPQSPHSYWLCYQKADGHLIVQKQNNVPKAPANVFAPIDLGTGTFIGAFQWTAQDEILVFYADQTKKKWCRKINVTPETPQATVAGLLRIIPSFGLGVGDQRQIASQRIEGNFRCAFKAAKSDDPRPTVPKLAEGLTEVGTLRVAPFVTAPFEITEHLLGMDLQPRRAQIQTAVEANKAVASNLTYLAEAYYFVPLYLAVQLQSRGQFTAALDWFRIVYDYRLPAAQRKIYHGLKLEETITDNYQRAANWLFDPLNPHAVAATRRNAFTRFTVLCLANCFLDFADAEFTRDTAESIPRARTLYLTALELLALRELQPPPANPVVATPFGSFAIPPNPILNALQLHAELNLFKLRNGRNIAGMQRQLDPYAAPTDAASGLPSIGGASQLALPGAVVLPPTPYRSSALIERAKQLAHLAAQMEAAMLSALEKRDGELYNLLKARQDVQLTRAGVRLQDLRVREAEHGVRLAELQQQRAQLQADYFQNLLEEDLLGLEKAALALLWYSLVQPESISATGVSYSPSGKLQTVSGILSTMANNERRRQEWRFQETLALQDVRIGAQQVKLADDHVRITGQERQIAGLQAEHAEAVVDFLAHKFTNAELFDWMSGILERVYAYFLQQATAVAKLAENQLAFERQETPPAFIQADYWEAPDESGAGTDSSSPDRRGLTGSARLLQDIFQLDQYAFATNQRKLQLAKTISLSQIAPAEFHRFRETGVLRFATPMELYDRDFPGHYLRLVRRVRTSVIALIPPTQGIRATLSTAGISRVVIGGPVFETAVVNQNTQSVALSSPRDATGLFELDQQPEMLLPFEGLGVDALWEFRMPKAANPFDYRTIADVLLTIEYTALDSPDYRQQVIQQLPSTLSADRPFSVRHQFADAWYELHNPDQSATPMNVRFETRREDFPPNLDQLRIQHVLLYFARAEGVSFELQVSKLRFKPEGGHQFEDIGSGVATVDGIISTRRAHAAGWLAQLNHTAPFGEWELSLKADDTVKEQELRNRFKHEEIEDILFIATYSGHTPAWPR